MSGNPLNYYGMAQSHSSVLPHPYRLFNLRASLYNAYGQKVWMLESNHD